MLNLIDGDPEAIADSGAQFVVAHQQVPDHPLLDAAGSLADVGDEIGHQVVFFPLLHKLIALSWLLVVVRPLELSADESTMQFRTDLFFARMDLRLPQSTVVGGFVVNVRVAGRILAIWPSR